MTSLNVSVPFYSFFYQVNWLLLLIGQKISQNTSDFLFLKIPIRFWVELPSLTDSSWHLFQLQLPSYAVGYWKGKVQVQVLWANSQLLGMTSVSFFSPDLDLQVQVHLSVYKLVRCLSDPGRPYKHLNMPKMQVSSRPLLVQVVSLPSSGVSSFLHWWLLHLSPAEASYALRWFKPVKGWSLIGAILFFGGEKNFTTSLVLDQSSWLAKKPPALSDQLVSRSFEFDIELEKTKSLHFGLGASRNVCACTSDRTANTANVPFWPKGLTSFSLFLLWGEADYGAKYSFGTNLFIYKECALEPLCLSAAGINTGLGDPDLLPDSTRP